MAVKKHSFEQYIQEQESFSSLRSTKAARERHYSHNRVFDEPQSLKASFAQQTNGSQTVHNSPTHSNVLEIDSQQLDQAEENGSQTVHKESGYTGRIETEDVPQVAEETFMNGSQMVHKCSTYSSVTELDRQQLENIHKSTVQTDNPSYNDGYTAIETSSQILYKIQKNGSQTVHRESSQGNNNNDALQTSQPVQNNGSQTVHETHAYNRSIELGSAQLSNEGKIIHHSHPASHNTESISSQVLHDAQVASTQQTAPPLNPGIQATMKPEVTQLHKEVEENGSQTVHESSALSNTTEIDSRYPMSQSGDYDTNLVNVALSQLQSVIAVANDKKTINSNIQPSGIPVKQVQQDTPSNGSQTVHEYNTQPHTNGSQFEPNAQVVDRMVHERNTKPYTNSSQLVHSDIGFASLPSIQRQLLKALYLNSQTNGNRLTQRLTLSYIADLSGVRKTSLKNTIWRLKNKGFLITKEYREGRAGWVIYEIPREIFLEIRSLENGSRTVHERFTEPITQPASYSSSYLNTITTRQEDGSFVNHSSRQLALPVEWQEIDVEPLEKIKFSKSKLIDLYETKLTTPEIVQASINNFAWGLENNPEQYKKYENPLTVFIGTLRKGKPWIESGYESPQEIALKELLKQEEQKKKRLDALVDDLVDKSYKDWEEELSEDEKKEIVPQVFGKDKEISDRFLKAHYKKEVLIPKLKRDGLYK
jgi:hypothetical protein